MTKHRKLTILSAACVVAIVTPGLFFIRMRAGVEARSVKAGSVHPVLSIPRARLGGTVREVLVKTGDRVEAGQLLMRIEAKELETRLVQLRKAAEAAAAAAKGGDALSQIPNQVRQYLYEAHPDSIKAEREYVEALSALEHAQNDDREAANRRFRHAEEERTLVRRRLAKLFAARANGGDSVVYQAELARNIAEVEKLLLDAEVHAPCRGLVDLLEAHQGDTIQLGQPLTVLVSTQEYSVEFAVTQTEFKRIHASMELKGRIGKDNRRIEGRVESISMRKLPVISRDKLQTAQEPVVLVRILSSAPLRAGSSAEFELP